MWRSQEFRHTGLEHEVEAAVGRPQGQAEVERQMDVGIRLVPGGAQPADLPYRLTVEVELGHEGAGLGLVDEKPVACELQRADAVEDHGAHRQSRCGESRPEKGPNLLAAGGVDLQAFLAERRVTDRPGAVGRHAQGCRLQRFALLETGLHESAELPARAIDGVHRVRPTVEQQIAAIGGLDERNRFGQRVAGLLRQAAAGPQQLDGDLGVRRARRQDERQHGRRGGTVAAPPRHACARRHESALVLRRVENRCQDVG
jgi:hypothetical protein